MTLTFFFNVTDTGTSSSLFAAWFGSDGHMRTLVARDRPDNQLILHQLAIIGLVSGYMRPWRVVAGSACGGAEDEGELSTLKG